MSTTTTTNAAPTITFDESSLRRTATNRSSTSQPPSNPSLIDEELGEEDPNAHAQDWTKSTEDHETWAARERRRSSMWSKAEMPSLSPKTTGGPRRGSILSVWKPGKDKDGRDILVHDDHDADDDEAIDDREDVVVVKPGDEVTVKATVLEGMGLEERRKSGTDRRGSILSLWSNGTDDKGRHIMVHDDEEWADEVKEKAEEK